MKFSSKLIFSWVASRTLGLRKLNLIFEHLHLFLERIYSISDTSIRFRTVSFEFGHFHPFSDGAVRFQTVDVMVPFLAVFGTLVPVFGSPTLNACVHFQKQRHQW